MTCKRVAKEKLSVWRGMPVYPLPNSVRLRALAQMRLTFWNGGWRHSTSIQLRFPQLNLKRSTICSAFALFVKAIGGVCETLGKSPTQHGRTIAQTLQR
jgi:hypothetical protein